MAVNVFITHSSGRGVLFGFGPCEVSPSRMRVLDLVTVFVLLVPLGVILMELPKIAGLMVPSEKLELQFGELSFGILLVSY